MVEEGLRGGCNSLEHREIIHRRAIMDKVPDTAFLASSAVQGDREILPTTTFFLKNNLHITAERAALLQPVTPLVASPPLLHQHV